MVSSRVAEFASRAARVTGPSDPLAEWRYAILGSSNIKNAQGYVVSEPLCEPFRSSWGVILSAQTCGVWCGHAHEVGDQLGEHKAGRKGEKEVVSLGKAR